MPSLFSATSSRQHERNLHNPALSEELRIRDILDDVAVMTNGTFVAAYELSGVHSYYHTEDMRNEEKASLEAVLRSLPERSMRLHVRFEIRQDTGSLIGRYADGSRSTNAVLSAIDEERCSKWLEKEGAGEFLNYRLHAMFHWDPVIHNSEPGHEWEQKLRRLWTLSGGKAIQRTHNDHQRLMSEFTSLLAGVETTLASTGMHVQRLHDDELFLLVRNTINPVDSSSDEGLPIGWTENRLR